MHITIHHPYRDGQANWLKGNLHTHTTVSDGPYSPQRTIEDWVLDKRPNSASAEAARKAKQADTPQ